MKKLLFLALLCLSFVAAQAANIFNKTGCPIKITPVCYDPVTCTSFPCGPVIVVPPGAVLPLPPPCACPVPFLQGYTVCWQTPPCAGICTNVSDAAGGPCANFPIQSMLPPCPPCAINPVNIFWTAAGDMVIR